MREILTTLFIFFLVLPTFAEERKSPKSSRGAVKFDFRGLRMGEPFPIDNPRFAESCARPQAGDLPSERTHCADVDERIGPVPVSISYTYLHKRFAGLMIFFKAKDFDTLVGGFTEKFGKPHQLTHKTVQTHAGATFINEIAIWHTDSGDLTVCKYGSDIEDGYAAIHSPEGLRDLNAQSDNDAKKAADGL